MKANSTLVISLVALALSIISLFGRHSMCIPEVVLTLIGICTTLIVGVSVVDALALRERRCKKITSKRYSYSSFIDIKIIEL